MKSITLASYAKVNISLDVGEAMEDGYHPVDMVMCQVLLHDLVQMSVFQDEGKWSEKAHGKDDDLKGHKIAMPQIEISANWPFVPCDERNICHKAVISFIRTFISTERLKSKLYKIPDKVSIVLKKRVPVGAGLGGGSGNAAAVIHGLNALLGTHFSMKELMEIGAELGADVPFAIMNQAKSCRAIPSYLRSDRLACTCARATGIGTELFPVKMPPRDILLVKPSFGASTREVYKGIDSCVIPMRPDNDRLVSVLEDLSDNSGEAESDEKCRELWDRAYDQMINVLENYTIKKNSVLQNLKQNLEDAEQTSHTMMSGSGTTIFSILNNDIKIDNLYPLINNLKTRGNNVIVTEILDGRSDGIAKKKKRGREDDN